MTNPTDTKPTEETKDEKAVEETPKEEVKDEEITEESVDEKVEEKGEIVEEEFDVEEFKKSTVEEAQKAVMEKIAKGLGLTKEEKEEAQKELVPPWEQRGETKPKSWKEHAEYSADLAEWKRKQTEAEIAKSQQDQENEATEVNKKWNDYWDSELKGLEESEEIPLVKDEKDSNDPGKKIRIKLFAKMKEVGDKRQAEGLAPITSVELIYRKYKDELNEEPSGSDAPVSFGKKGVSSSKGEDDYSYSEIHGKNFDQIKGK
jgi:hypothetical protein